VDHGKTSLLDKIRGTLVAKREAGGITQHVGASYLPLDTILDVVKGIEGVEVGAQLKIPGLLVIDTPGHQAFMNLRKRGGSIADFAILVVDVTAGVMPQTIESVEILNTRSTPYVIAANKVDLLKGWVPQKTQSILRSMKSQDQQVRRTLEGKLYEIVGELSRLGSNADLFYNIREFKGKAPVIPLSAKTGEGVAEMIAVMSGMIQSYLSDSLAVKSKRGRGTVLEVKKEVGLGLTLNVILYDGELSVNDTVVLSGSSGPIITKVRVILVPKPLDEMRDPRDKFTQVSSCRASAGVKLGAPDLEGALAGSSLIVANSQSEQKEAVDELSKEYSTFMFRRETEGLIVKADALGSLEALVLEFQKVNIKVRTADIGPVSRKDVVEASTASSSATNRAVLAFNVKVAQEAESSARDLGVRIFTGDIIYGLTEDYTHWKEEYEKSTDAERFSRIQTPATILVLPGYVFRRSKPAIFGVRVERGILRDGAKLLNSEGEAVGHVHSIRLKEEASKEARTGDEVSISVSDAVLGRNVREGQLLFVDVPSSDAHEIKTALSSLATPDLQQALEEVGTIKRKTEPYWGYWGEVEREG
jgi:translation initiation factor 5B